MTGERIDALLRRHFDLWEDNHRYLDLDWRHYSRTCPPLLFIGGCSVQGTSPPIVVVSIEPLRAKHFSKQVRFAAPDIRQYRRWNLEYFAPDVFPRLAGHRAQAYWRNMAAFVSGWTGEDVDVNVPWALFARHFIEIPYVPMHAKRHVPKASARAQPVLRDVFKQRAEAVLAHWPRAVFLVLSSSVADRLRSTISGLSPVRLPAATSAFGRRFSVAVEEGRLDVVGAPRVFVRRGPLSNWTNPRREGRVELGRILRRRADPH